MSASTDKTADELLALAHRAAQACRERQRRDNVREAEHRARQAALNASLDAAERQLREAGREIDRLLSGWQATREEASRLRLAAEGRVLSDEAAADLDVAQVNARVAEQAADDAEAKLAKAQRETADLLAMKSGIARLCGIVDCVPHSALVGDVDRMLFTAEERGARWALREQLLYCDRGPDRLAEIARDAARICAEARAKETR